MLKPRLAASAVLLCCSAPLGAQSLNDPLLDDLQLPTVLSATRLKQSPAEVPGSMTVIDRQLIRASGARDIPELMRLVPVSTSHGHLCSSNRDCRSHPCVKCRHSLKVSIALV